MKKGQKHTKESILKMRIIKVGKKLTEEHKRKIGLAVAGEKNYFFGKKLTEEHKRKIVMTRMKNNSYTPTETARRNMSLAKLGKKNTQKHRENASLARRGEKSHFWKGGVSTQNELDRKTLKYKIWRESVFKRDNYTCVLCGDRSGNGHRVDLNADHIKPFAHYPELRFSIENGRTLCVPCHKKTDTFGFKSNKKI